MVELLSRNGVWRSLVARFVRDEEAVGSNPATPTVNFEADSLAPVSQPIGQLIPAIQQPLVQAPWRVLTALTLGVPFPCGLVHDMHLKIEKPAFYLRNLD